MKLRLSDLEFRGYQHSDGTVGVRNHLLIMPTDTNSVTIASRVMNQVKDTVSLTKNFVQPQSGPEHERVYNTLLGLALNGNVGSTMLLSFDDQNSICGKVHERLVKAGREVKWISIAEEGGEVEAQHEAVLVAREMAKKQRKIQRTRVGIHSLIVALECGGSDTTSGLASNPAVGVASDMLVSAGATSIISEVPEFVGAERLFASRSVNKRVKNDVVSMVESFEDLLKKTGMDFRGAQPTPGNQAGGLTTIEEKSLGAVLKAGSAKVSGVLGYAERPKTKGLFLMNTPGYDVESVTGMVAGGAQIVLFTTGRGSPLGNAVSPVIKITANPTTYDLMKEHIDINASGIIKGSVAIERVGERIFDMILAVASGKNTKAELLGHTEFAITRVLFQ